MRLGVIGTGSITKQFIEAAQTTGHYQLAAVYSRSKKKATTFATEFSAGHRPAVGFSDLPDFLASEVEVVYIASPNSVHFAQAKAALLAGKNIIVEKPAFSTPHEMSEIIHLAATRGLFYFEAARHIHEPGFEKLQSSMPTANKIVGADFTYAKYSSRYDAVLAGEEPNIFSPKFSGGALMDLGVYLVYAAVSLFGSPEESFYRYQKVATGVDGRGTALLRYDHFDVTLHCGKINDATTSNEIYTTAGTIFTPTITGIEEVSHFERTSQTTTTNKITLADNPMVYEANRFAEMMNNPDDFQLGQQYEELVELSRQVNFVLTRLRHNSGLIFAADMPKD